MNLVYPDFEKNEPLLKENAVKYFERGWEVFPMIAYKKYGIVQTIYAAPWKEVTFYSELFFEYAESLKEDYGFWCVIACKTGSSKITVVERNPKIKNDEADSLLNSPDFVRCTTPEGKIRYFFQHSPEVGGIDREDLGVKVLPNDAIVYLPPSYVIKGN